MMMAMIGWLGRWLARSSCGYGLWANNKDEWIFCFLSRNGKSIKCASFERSGHIEVPQPG